MASKMAFTIEITNQTLANYLNDVNATIGTTTLSLDPNYTLLPTLDDIAELDFNLTQHFGPKRDPLYVVLPITFIYMLIFVTGVIGNISTCIVIAKNRSMHTATNYYLFSLAVSDLLLLTSGVPQEVYSIWSKYPYVFGEVFCVARGLMAETSANATVLTITSFTVERYLAICHPFLQHTMSKLSRAVKLVIVVWIVSIALAIPQALQFGVVTLDYGVLSCQWTHEIIKHSFELSTLLFFFAPMTLITVLYILIGLKLRTSGLMKRENGVSMQRRVHVNSCRQQASAGTRRVLKMLVAVVVAFFFCWAPFHAQRLVAFYGGEVNIVLFTITTYVSGILYYLSTCINPLLYNIMSNKFREAFKETLAHFCSLSKRGDDSQRAYRILSRGQRRWRSHQESGDYSGSSYREDSVHSTLTQKQSVDSMIVTRDSQSHYVTTKIATPNINQTKRKLKRMDSNLLNDSIRSRNHNKFNKTPSATAAAAAATAAVALNRKIVFEIYTQSQEGALRSATVNSNQMPLATMKLPSNHRQNEYQASHNNNNHDPSPALLRHSSVPKRKELKLTIIPIPTVVTATAAASPLATHTSATSTPLSVSPPSIATKPIAFIRNLFVSLRQSKSRPGFYSPTRDLPAPIGKIALQLSTNVNIDDDDHEAIEEDDYDYNDDKSNDIRHGQLSGDEGDGSISNSSMGHVDQNALEDELSAYMQELREREKR